MMTQSVESATTKPQGLPIRQPISLEFGKLAGKISRIYVVILQAVRLGTNHNSFRVGSNRSSLRALMIRTDYWLFSECST